MPLLDLYDQVVKSAKQVEDIPWHEFEDVEDDIRQTIERSLKAMEEMSDEDVDVRTEAREELLRDLSTTLQRLQSGMEARGAQLRERAADQLLEVERSLQESHRHELKDLDAQLKDLRAAQQQRERAMIEQQQAQMKAQRDRMREWKARMAAQEAELAEEAQQRGHEMRKRLQELQSRLKGRDAEARQLKARYQRMMEQADRENADNHTRRLMERIREIESSSDDRDDVAAAILRELAGEHDSIQARDDAILELRKEVQRLRKEVEQLRKGRD